MSMTLQEAAIKSCEDRIKHLESTPIHHYGKRQRERAIELERVKIAALRPITREQVEKVWRGCEYCKKHKINLVRIEMDYNDSPGSPERLNPTRIPKFCPICGAPMTEEAVEIIMERLEETT